MKEFIVYVSAPILNSSARLKEFVTTFKSGLRRQTTAIVLEWVSPTDEEIKDFFERDLGNVYMCSAMIAFVDEPSTGIGIEIAEVIRQEKPLLCLYRKGTKVSRMILGATATGTVTVREYSDLSGAVDIAAKFIEQEQKKAEAA